MKVTFWGVRGSLPSPLRPKQIEDKVRQIILGLPEMDTSDEQAVQSYLDGLPTLLKRTAGGNTACVEVQTGGETLIIDAGSGLRELGQELIKGPCGRGEGVLHLLISHLHWDHIQGFPSFAPAFIPGNKLFIYGIHDIKQAFEYQQRSPMHWPVSVSYMQADKEFISLQAEQSFCIGDVWIRTIENTHPGKAYSFRLEGPYSTFVYASDIEYKDMDEASLQPYIDFFRGADALVFDAQYTLREAWQKVDWGHSSALIGVDLARAAGVKRLLLFHYDPTYSDADLLDIQAKAIDYQAQDPNSPTCEVIVACEGLTLDLISPGVINLQFASDGAAAILTPKLIFDKFGVDQIAQQLDGLDSNPIIDLSQVQTLTTPGLKALVALRQMQQNTPIILVTPSESVRQVIKLAGYQDYFAIYPSLEAALQAEQVRESLNLPGQILQDRYQIGRELGKGYIGIALKATDIHSDQTVVIKVFSPAISQETLAQFTRQSPQIIRLDHPNIVQVFAWYEQGVKAEEYIAGRTLKRLLAENQALLPSEQAMNIAADIARALEYAHSRGVIHGNLNPTKVLLTDKGAKLCDFGLGCLEQGRNLLQAPLLFLSPAYLAPEQILGQPLDARSDLYSFGVVLYELFTGRPPFMGDVQQVLESHLHLPPPAPRELNPELSRSFEHLILKLLAKNPNERYASAQQTRRISSSLIVNTEDASGLGQTILIGREKQVQILESCWQEALNGRGQLVFITGEAGIGKSSLAQQVAVNSQAPVCLVGSCQEIKAPPPYHLFRQVLRVYFATVPPEFLQDRTRQLATNFVGLLPELSQMLPDSSPPAPLEPEQEQLRLMVSLTQFIRHATRERAWFLILDDLQWADPNSLQLLRYLCRHLPTMHLLLVGAYRDVELERSHPLRETLRNLSSRPSYRHLPLERLDQAGVEQHLFKLWQQAAPPKLAQRIYQHTQGNPFYVEEVAKGLLDDGLVILQDGYWRFPAPDQVHLPPSVHEAVWQRIGRLNPDTQDLLRQAAVLGQSFSFEALCEMSGLSEWQVLEHLDVALDRQLVQEMPGDSLLRFRHTEIQHVLYADLGALRRRLLHRLAGKALERQAQPEPERIAEALAHHFIQAHELDKAISYSLHAGRQAQTAYANESALSWYRQTLDLIEQLGPKPASHMHTLCISTHQSLGEVLSLIGRYDEALSHFTLAQTWLKTETLTCDQACQFTDLCCQVAQIHQVQGKFILALNWLQKGLDHYPDFDKPTIELARTYAMLGQTQTSMGNYSIAQNHLERALKLARSAHWRQVEASSVCSLGTTWWYLSDYAQAKSFFEQSLEIYRQVDDREGEGRLLNSLGVVCRNQGDFVQASVYYQRSLNIRREIGDQRGESATSNNLALVHWQLGDCAKAIDFFEQSLFISKELGDLPVQSHTLNNLSRVYRGQGELDMALAHCQQAMQIFQEIGDRNGQASAFDNMGFIYLCYGDYSKAREYLNQSVSICQEIGQRKGASNALDNLSLLAYLEKNDKLALQYHQQSMQIAKEIQHLPNQGYALTHLGHILLRLERLDEAADAYQQAVHIRQELGLPNLAVESLAGLARVALAQGALTRAQTHVEEILHYLETRTLNSTEEPFRIHLTCYQVLRANQDPRADDVLEQAHTRLLVRSAKISDPQLGQAFLENASCHLEILHEWQHK